MLGNSVNMQQEEIERLKEFVECTMKEINNISQLLNWDPKTLENVEEFCVCPYDSSHRIPKKSLDRHLVSCQWKAEGYQETDLPLSESTGVQSRSSIKFDEQLQAQVLQSSRMESAASTGLAERLIPRTSDRLLIDFTPNERRSIYEYVIANTVKPEIGRDIADGQANQSELKHEKELSYLELLAQERNMKRRRAKHKGVHTNKKSHTEILREVINQQMEIYVEHITGNAQDTSTSEPLEQVTADTPTEPAEEKEQYFPRMRDKSMTPHPSTFLRDTFEDQGSSRKYETYNPAMSRYGMRPQDQQKYEKHSQEKYDRKESSRRHSHHEHKRKSRSEYHDSAEDTHRSKHKSHKSKSHSSRKREGSHDHYYSHHSRDKREKREKHRNRD